MQIRLAAAVVADISCYEESERALSNPNVSFEAGLATGIHKPVFYVSATPERIPADFRAFDVFRYPEDFRSGRLGDCIQAVVSKTPISTGLQLMTSKAAKKFRISEIEELPGNWMIGADYHSYLFRPLDVLKGIVQRSDGDGANMRERLRLLDHRWANFSQILERGEAELYHVFEREGIEEYFRTGLLRRAAPEAVQVRKCELLAEIDYSVELLRRYGTRLKVAFTSRPLPYAFFIVKGSCVFIDSKSNHPHTLNGLFMTYRSVVTDMESVFWEYWDAIPELDRSTGSAIETYEYMRKVVEQSKEVEE